MQDITKRRGKLFHIAEIAKDIPGYRTRSTGCSTSEIEDRPLQAARGCTLYRRHLTMHSCQRKSNVFRQLALTNRLARAI
jgi:hypothetical protein